VATPRTRVVVSGFGGDITTVFHGCVSFRSRIQYRGINVSEAVGQRLRSFVTDLSLYSVANAVPALLSLAALVLFSRLFSPTSFGRYSLALAVVGVSSTLLFGWLDYVILRYAPQLDEEQVVGNTLSLYGGVALGFAAVGTAGFFVIGEQLGPYRPFYLAALALALGRGLLQPVLALFRALLDAKRATLFRLLQAVVGLAAAVCLAVFLFDHIVGWMWGTVVGVFVALLVAFGSSDTLRTRPSWEQEHVRRLLRYGLPMIGFIVGDELLTQADRFVVEILAGSAAVGIYSANYMLVDRGLRLAYTPIIQTINPRLVDAWDGDNEADIGRMLHHFTRVFVLLAAPALALVTIMSQTMSDLVVGEGFEEGFVIIPIVGVGLMCWALANLVQVVFEIKERTPTLSMVVLTLICLNLVLNIPLVALFGYLGAAVATTLSYVLYGVYVAVRSSRHVDWVFPVWSSVRATIAGLAMVLPAGLLYVAGAYTIPTSVLAAVVGAVIYPTLLWLLGEVDAADRRRIWEALGD
jgi:O-antigen/teichoic acid export membrane protein